jgi:hypothetical protein
LLRCPSFNPIREEEIFHMMPVEQRVIPEMADDVIEVLAVVGLTQTDLVDLLSSGVKVAELLEYVEAVVSDRMN